MQLHKGTNRGDNLIMSSVSEDSLMDDPLQKSLGSLHQNITKRTKKAVKVSSIEEKEENLFKAQSPDPSPRDQQDLMALPFFSLAKTKRTKPIIYEQGNVSVVVAGLSTVGIATIWDADFLIWIASQLNAALEAGEAPTRRLWFIPYHFLRATKRINPKTTGNYAYARFLDCLRRLQGTTIETTIKAGGEQIRQAWSWLESWRVHEDQNGRMTGVEVLLSEWFFRRVVDDRSVLAIHTDYFLLTGGIERWLYRIARKHCGNNESGWSFTLHKLYEKYPPGREFRFFKRDLKTVVKNDCLPEYHTAWETSKGVDWIHFYLRQGTIGERKLPHSLR
jgi:plasmid replication initiation protein